MLTPAFLTPPFPTPRMLLHNPSPASTSPSTSPSPSLPDPLTHSLSHLHTHRVVLCIRHPSAQTALLAAQAALDGGLRTIEVALTTPQAPALIRTLRAYCPSALIGAGTVLTPLQADRVHQSGAQFALSPVLETSVVDRCRHLGMLSVPAGSTPTECYNAYMAGAKVVKVFPINLYGGLDFVNAMQGPLPFIPLLPTSGVDTQSLPYYLDAPNVCAIGASRQIMPKDALENEDWTQIRRRAGEWAAIAAPFAR